MSPPVRIGTPAQSQPGTAVDAPLFGARSILLALGLTASAATLGLGVSWAVEKAANARSSMATVASIDAPTQLAYSRSSARVSGDFGAP